MKALSEQRWPWTEIYRSAVVGNARGVSGLQCRPAAGPTSEVGALSHAVPVAALHRVNRRRRPRAAPPVNAASAVILRRLLLCACVYRGI